MNRAIITFLGSLLACSAFANQSVNTNSACTPGSTCPTVALPNSAPFTTAGNNSQRWEFRVHAASFTNERIVNLGPVYFIISGGRFELTYSLNPPVTDTLSAPLDPVLVCCSGYTDISVRVQRDVPNLLYTVEVCQTSTSACVTQRYTINTLGTAINWDTFSVEFDSGFDVAWYRWFSTLVASGTIIQNTNTGDVLDWEFESTLADSVIGLTFSNPVGVTYTTTPVFNPSCRPFTQQTFKTGVVGSVTAVGLCQSLDGGAAPTPLWSYLGTGADGITQSSLVFGSAGALTTTVSGQINGSVNLNLHLLDGSGNTSDTAVHDGAVTVDANDVVITGLPNADIILGPMLRYGSPNNRSQWFDDRNKAFADYWGALLSSTFPDYWDTFATGTVAFTPTQTCGNSLAGYGIVGTGTHFTSLYKYGTSATSQTIGTGSKTFTTQSGLGYTALTSYARFTSAANPANFMAGTVTAYSGTTITVTVDSVGGSGTHTDWNVSDDGDNYIVFAWNAGANRRLNNVVSVFSDTCLIVLHGWDGGTTETGRNYVTPTATNVANWCFAGCPAPGNYYDNVEAFNALYRRSGIDTYWTSYATLADNHWHQPAMDQGRSYSPQNNYQFATRSQSLQGMMLRAMDPGMSSMWDGLHTIISYDIAYQNANMSHGWANTDQREYAAYPMLFIALDALLDPDPTYMAASKSQLSTVMPLFTAGLSGDGSFPSSFFTVANQTDQAVFTQGSKTVTCAGCSTWAQFSGTPITVATATAANPMVLSLLSAPQNVVTGGDVTISGATGTGCSGMNGVQPVSAVTSTSITITFNGTGCTYTTNSASIAADSLSFASYDGYPTYPTTNTPYSSAYYPTFVDAHTLRLERAYAEVSGTKGWATGNPVVGFGTQAFMEGIQGSAFTKMKSAIAVSDPTTSTLAGTYAQGVGDWLTTYGYADPAHSGVGGMYYFANFRNCSYPVQTVACTLGFTASQSRTDAAESLKGLGDAYLQAPTRSKLTFGNKIYDEMYCKPGTGGTCTSDGFYVDDLNDGTAGFLNPFAISNKWFGFFFGYSAGVNWAAISASAGGSGGFVSGGNSGFGGKSTH